MSQKKSSGRSSDVIDDNLKRVYQEVLDEELPDRFNDLLQKLRTQDSGSSKEGKSK